MPRPPCCRQIAGEPACTYFKPRGVPLVDLEEVALGLDEFEALRLADLEGLYQEDAAKKMNVSRPTFTRIVQSARQKVAGALVNGKALKLEGGNVTIASLRRFCCGRCKHTWELPHGSGRPSECPKCQGRSLHCAPEEGGRRRCSRGQDGRGRGCCHGGGRQRARAMPDKEQDQKIKKEGASK